MTVAEVGKVLDLLQVNYGQGQRMTNEERTLKTKLWAMQFANDDFETVGRAVYSLIRTNKFMPNVAEVKEQMRVEKLQTQRISAIKRLHDKRLAALGRAKALEKGTGGGA